MHKILHDLVHPNYGNYGTNTIAFEVRDLPLKPKT